MRTTYINTIHRRGRYFRSKRDTIVRIFFFASIVRALIEPDFISCLSLSLFLSLSHSHSFPLFFSSTRAKNRRYTLFNKGPLYVVLHLFFKTHFCLYTYIFVFEFRVYTLFQQWKITSFEHQITAQCAMLHCCAPNHIRHIMLICIKVPTVFIVL